MKVPNFIYYYGGNKMEFSIKEYKKYNEEEILNLYKSVGWINYTDNPKMLEEKVSKIIDVKELRWKYILNLKKCWC